jgi:hypothetical protein
MFSQKSTDGFSRGLEQSRGSGQNRNPGSVFRFEHISKLLRFLKDIFLSATRSNIVDPSPKF